MAKVESYVLIPNLSENYEKSLNPPKNTTICINLLHIYVQCNSMYSNLACFIRQKGEGLINQSWMAQYRAVGTYEEARTGSPLYFADLLTLSQSGPGERARFCTLKKLVPTKHFDIPAAL